MNLILLIYFTCYILLFVEEEECVAGHDEDECEDNDYAVEEGDKKNWLVVLASTFLKISNYIRKFVNIYHGNYVVKSRLYVAAR